MMTKKVTDATREPAALSVVMCSNVTSAQAAGPLSASEKVEQLMGGEAVAKSVKQAIPASEAPDGAPVAGGMDPAPTNWFELGVVLCAERYLTPERLHNALHSQHQVQG